MASATLAPVLSGHGSDSAVELSNGLVESHVPDAAEMEKIRIF